MAKGKRRSWYSINFLGGLTIGLYAFVPAYTVYADSLGLIDSSSRLIAALGMLFVASCVVVARRRKIKIFSTERGRDLLPGFTLIELLVVISIIGILSVIILPSVNAARQAAYEARSKAELRQIGAALELYANSIGGYPPDADRDLPSGLEAYLSSGNWPDAPWPGSVYDWDNWASGNLSYAPQAQVYQISIRFCPLGEPENCNFPNEEWAADFDYYSAAYYCVGGPCRSHSSKPLEHPGYCTNC